MKQPLEWLRYTPKAVLGKVLNPLGIGLDELWLASWLRRCRQFNPGEFDVVLATGSPFSTFIAARRIARRLNTPYILDYRDPWSLSPLLKKGARLLGRARERNIAEGAAAMLTVSPSWANLQASGLRLSKYPTVISNGYDPEECNAAVPASPKGTSIVYAGSFYKGQREIGPLLKALKLAVEKLPADGPELTFHYYGDGVQHVTEAAKDVGVEDHVLCHGNVPRGDVLSAIKGASVAVVIAGIRERTDLAERGIVTGKIFEPLGMGVPILLMAHEGSDATAIVEGSGAGRSFRASQTEAMAEWLLELAREPAKARYQPPKGYSWPVLAARLDEVLRRSVLERQGAIADES
jgi:glycosyltransferase involved in cell wall biosynthesis